MTINLNAVFLATQAVFLTLKLTNVVNWAWVWVLSPAWIFTGIYFVALVTVLIVAFLANRD